MNNNVTNSKQRTQANRLKPGSILAILSIVYLVFAIFISQSLHFSRALDEGYHLEYITFIKKNGRLPISYEERAHITKSDYPPLYHILVTLLSTSVEIGEEPNFKYFWDSFRYRVVDHQNKNPWTLDTEDYRWPYYGRFLVWQIGRWFSIVLSVSTIIVVFFTLQDIPLGQKPLTSFLGAASLAFMPRYLIVGSSLNDDNLLGLLAALYFWMLVKAVKKPTRWWPFVLMGILLGISITVKYSVAIIPLEVLLICGVIAYRSKLGWVWWLQRLGVVGLLALLCASWWFGWNIWYLNTIAQNGWIVGTTRALFAGGYDITLNRISGILSGGTIGLTERPENIGEGTLSEWIYTTFLTFWGYSTNGVYPLYPYSYITIAIILIVASVGLWRMWHSDPKTRVWLSLTAFHLGLFWVLPLLRFNLSHRIGETAQGRHILIPAATAVVALVVWGLVTVVPKRWHKIAVAMIIGLNVSWTTAHLYRLVAFSSPPLPLRTGIQVTEWLPEPVNAQFGDGIELAGYEIDPHPENGVLKVNLVWQSLAYVSENYLLRVLLVDEAREVVSHWTGYSGHGRLPSLAWDPGDVIFDRLVLPLPNLPVGDYTLHVQVLNRTGPLVVTMPGRDAGPARAREQGSTIEGGNILSLADVMLDEPSTLPLNRRVVVTGTSGLTEIAFGLWKVDGSDATIQNPKSKNHNSIYRYPATISIITSVSDLKLALIDSFGQAWPATQSEANIHTFVIGPRWQSGEYRLQMALQESGKVIEQIVSEPLLTVENWWKRQFEVPEIAVPSEANFANQLKFLGYELPQNQVKAGEAFPLTLYWQALPDRSPQANFIQFNHLLDSSGTLYGGYDRRPLEYYSTLLWAPGEVIVDGYAVPVNAHAPPGEYYLDVGYYLPVGESAVNLPLLIDGEMTDVKTVTIGPIEVVAQ